MGLLHCKVMLLSSTRGGRAMPAASDSAGVETAGRREVGETCFFAVWNEGDTETALRNVEHLTVPQHLARLSSDLPRGRMAAQERWHDAERNDGTSDEATQWAAVLHLPPWPLPCPRSTLPHNDRGLLLLAPHLRLLPLNDPH